MKPVAERFEVVQVIGGFRLLDGQSQERVYWRHDGMRLAPGFYAVHCPSGVPAQTFNDAAVFRGPFKRREDAETALAELQARAAFRGPQLAYRRRPPERVVPSLSVARSASTGSSPAAAPRHAPAPARLIPFTGGKRQ